MKTFAILALLYSSFYFYSCGKTCVEATYNFNMTERFYPEQDSIKIGDTVWTVSSHSTTFNDTVSGNSVDYNGSTLGLNIRLLNYTASSNVDSGNLGAFHSFTTVVTNGSEVGNDNIPDENKGVNFQQMNNQYFLKVAFVPKEKGIFGISLSDAVAMRRHNGCELAYVTITNDNTNKHLYYYQNIRPDYEISSYEKTHLYCFKVY